MGMIPLGLTEFDCKIRSELIEMIEELRADLLKSQADNARLRDALLEYRAFFSSIPAGKQALATNSSDDALKEYGAKLVKRIISRLLETGALGEGDFIETIRREFLK